MVRAMLVWLHRWVGLLMALFLVLEGLTGSVLAFRGSIDSFVAPALFATPRPGAAPLRLAQFATFAEARDPRIRVGYFSVEDRQAVMHVQPRIDPRTGRPYDLQFDRIFLDPWTGRELGRRLEGDLSQGIVNLVPFLYRLHMNLALGAAGELVLGIVALAWTIDCAVGLYLTFPAKFGRFFARWKPTWLIKHPASAIRVNYDLHRASGLWLWPLLFVLAWSSVMFNLRETVYEPVTHALFDYRSGMETYGALGSTRRANTSPKLGWIAAEAAGERLMKEQAAAHRFSIERPYGMAYIDQIGVYTYGVIGSENQQSHAWSTSLWLDGDTGSLVELDLPSGEHAGNTVEAWLRALHFADVHDWFAYRLTVCFLGLVIAMLSITGIYIWLRKRRARLHAASRASPAEMPSAA